MCRYSGKAERGSRHKWPRVLVELPSFTAELVVEIGQLTQESVVGSDLAVTSDLGQGLDGRHVLPHHQVRQHARARTGHAHEAVHQNLAWKWNQWEKLRKAFVDGAGVC